MAGPALGRILKSSIKEKFVSANLPLLHKRTISGKNTDEYRSGILRNEDSIDLSGEFIKQFWGDVMLFSINELTESGYPEKKMGLQQVTRIVDRTCGNLSKLYMEQQPIICEKVLKLKNYLTDTSCWWNTFLETADALKRFHSFISAVENNFGADSPVMKNLSEQIKTKIYSEKIIQAIRSFHEDEIYWKEALTSAFSSRG